MVVSNKVCSLVVALATTLVATAAIAGCIIPLALLVPFAWLAESTSLATLAVFALVNLALLRLRLRGEGPGTPRLTGPVWAPAVGLATCLAMIATALLR